MAKLDWEKERRRQELLRGQPSGGQERPLQGRTFQAKYSTTKCSVCRQRIERGDYMRRFFDGWAHRSCTEPR